MTAFNNWDLIKSGSNYKCDFDKNFFKILIDIVQVIFNLFYVLELRYETLICKKYSLR